LAELIKTKQRLQSLKKKFAHSDAFYCFTRFCGQFSPVRFRAIAFSVAIFRDLTKEVSMTRNYDKAKDSVWGLTDSQSNEIREKQDNGASQKDIAEAIEEKQKENGF
jgi:hypothetical protein